MVQRVKMLVCVLMATAMLTVGCAKQTPEMPPGAAAIANVKLGVRIAKGASTATKDALPDLMKDADQEDKDTANGILSDVDFGLKALEQKIDPYTSFDSSNEKDIKQAVKDFVDLLKQLQRDRVTHIKNPRVVARINLGLGLASGALDLWQPTDSTGRAPAKRELIKH